MKTLYTHCYDITISYDPANKAEAVITSTMNKPDTPENDLFNATVTGLEAMILAHFLAGVDITASAYLDGIEMTYQALRNRCAEGVADDNIVTVEKSRRVNASVDETVHYEVNKADWQAALDEHGSEEIALYELQCAMKATRTFCEAEIDEVNEEFDVSIAEL